VGPKSLGDAVSEGFHDVGSPEFHLHSLRHYTVTELIAAGLDDRTVATTSAMRIRLNAADLNPCDRGPGA
jgi:hypothetical protein